MGFKNWINTTWGVVSELKYGKALRDYKGNIEGIPVFGTNGQIGYTDKCLTHGPGIVIGRKGAYRGVHYSNKDFYVIDTAYFLKVDEEIIDVRWAYYELISQDINSLDSGSAIPSTRREDFYALKVKIPPLSIQKKIVEVLNAFDMKIDLNLQIVSSLEQLAQTLFKRWFVDFEFPNENGDPYKSSGGEMVESELGMIPAGWTIKKIGELVDFAYGKPLKKADRINGSYPVYGSNGIVDYHESALVEGPGIIIGRKGNPGTVNYEKNDFFPIDTTFYVVKKDQDSSFIFIYFMLANQNLANLSADSAVPGLNRNHAYQSNFILPSIICMDEFEDLLKPIFDRRFLLIEENDKLTALRDTLLPKLLSGEIELPNETEVTEDVSIS